MYTETDNKNYPWKLKDYYSIVAVELIALQKATSLYINKQKPTSFFTDSQTAIALIMSHRQKAYKNAVITIHRNLRNAKNKPLIHWVPGNSDIRGTDIADESAKKAAQSSFPPSSHFPELE